MLTRTAYQRALDSEKSLPSNNRCPVGRKKAQEPQKGTRNLRLSLRHFVACFFEQEVSEDIKDPPLHPSGGGETSINPLLGGA
jgi:hypothetical protein